MEERKWKPLSIRGQAQVMMPSIADVDRSPELVSAAVSWHSSPAFKVPLDLSGLTFPAGSQNLCPSTPQGKLVYINWVRHVTKDLSGKDENVDLGI